MGIDKITCENCIRLQQENNRLRTELKNSQNYNYSIIQTNSELVMLNKILIQREIDKVDRKIFD